MAEKKARFTVIDLLIIIAVAAAAAVLAVKVLPSGLGGEKNKVVFTVMLTQKEEGFIDAMKIGDRVSISNKEHDMGTVTALEKKPCEVMLYDSIDGEYRNEVLEEKQDVYVTIEADAVITDSLIKAGKTPVKVGLEMPVRGKGYASMGYVIKVSEEAGE